MTIAGPNGAGPAAELAVLKLWEIPAPTIAPKAKMAASPSPARKEQLPARAPARQRESETR